MQVRRTTAIGSAGERARNSVVLVHLHHVVTNSRILIFNETRWEHRYIALRFGEANLWALLKPSGETLLGKWRQHTHAGNARCLFDHFANERARLGTHDHIADYSSFCCHFAQCIGVPHDCGGEFVASRNLAVGATHGVCTKHKAREIECPFVQFGNVRAHDVTQFALETLVSNVILLSRRHLACVLIVVRINVRKQRWERRAKLKAQSTSVAQVVHALELFASVGLVEIERVMRIVNCCHCLAPLLLTKKLAVDVAQLPMQHPPSTHYFLNQEMLFKPSAKRPAWLFSARARVSNQSAISAKPSSRAVFAKPGYIWVYS